MDGEHVQDRTTQQKCPGRSQSRHVRPSAVAEVGASNKDRCLPKPHNPQQSREHTPIYKQTTKVGTFKQSKTCIHEERLHIVGPCSLPPSSKRKKNKKQKLPHAIHYGKTFTAAPSHYLAAPKSRDRIYYNFLKIRAIY
jgi:hypothetical protein